MQVRQEYNIPGQAPALGHFEETVTLKLVDFQNEEVAARHGHTSCQPGGTTSEYMQSLNVSAK